MQLDEAGRMSVEQFSQFVAFVKQKGNLKQPKSISERITKMAGASSTAAQPENKPVSTAEKN